MVQQSSQTWFHNRGVYTCVSRELLILSSCWSAKHSQMCVTAADADVPTSYSTLGPFPWAEYAPYTQRDYSWNTAAGSNQLSLALTGFPAPVFLLTPEMAADARQRATYNSKGVSLLCINGSSGSLPGGLCVWDCKCMLSAQLVSQ
jgi:hypothetical protein